MNLTRNISCPSGSGIEFFSLGETPRLLILRALIDENACSYFVLRDGDDPEYPNGYFVPDEKKLVIVGISAVITEMHPLPFPGLPTILPIFQYFGFTDKGVSLDCPAIDGNPVEFYYGGASVYGCSPFIVCDQPKQSQGYLSEPYFAEIPATFYPYIATGALDGSEGPRCTTIVELYGYEVNA